MDVNNIKSEVRRVNGYLKEVTTFFDASGKPISHIMNPLMVELKPRDILQIMIGSLLMATPLSFTEEVWIISKELSDQKIILMSLVSSLTVTLFIYFNFYRGRLKGNIIQFIKRILATYIITLLSASMILLLIDKLPIFTDLNLAIRRSVIVGLPSVFAATLSDYLK